MKDKGLNNFRPGREAEYPGLVQDTLRIFNSTGGAMSTVLWEQSCSPRPHPASSQKSLASRHPPRAPAHQGCRGDQFLMLSA